MRFLMIVLCALLPGCVKMMQKVPAAASCPPSNAEIPYLQLKANPEAFVGCRIGTQVAFLGTGNPGTMRQYFEEDQVWKPGETLFAVAAPNDSEAARQASQGGVQGGILVNGAGSQTLYSAKPGQLFHVVGEPRGSVYAGQTYWMIGIVEMAPVAGR